MCCGSRRATWRLASVSTRQPREANAPAPHLSGPTKRAPAIIAAGPGVTVTKLRYADSTPIRLRGPITRRAYDFSDADPVQEVDVRDAAIFVRSLRSRLSAL